MRAWEKFRKNALKGGLVREGDKILIAVSGGPDSVCLAHLFWRLKKTFPVDLSILYVNHGLRKKAAEKEERFIISFGRKLGIPAIIDRIPVKEYSRNNKVSVETAGRALRYNALEMAAKKLKFNKIATGHTANDNAETVLMWLFRGTGPDGLAGIPAQRKTCGNKSVIRPMLSITRREIREYVKKQGLKYCVDLSNFSPDYTRNRIRHELIPIFEKYNPGFIEHISALSKIVSLDNQYINSKVIRAVKDIVNVSSSRISLDLKRFLRYNKAVKLRILKDILPERCSSAKVFQLLEWVDSGSKSRVPLSGNWIAVKTGNRLILSS